MRIQHRIFIFLLALILSPSALAIPVYFEGVVQSVEQEGEFLTSWGINENWAKEGGFVNGLLDVRSDRLQELADRNYPWNGTRIDGLRASAYYSYVGHYELDSFISSTFVDQNGSNADRIRYGATAQYESVFNLVDNSIEKCCYDLSVFRLDTASVANQFIDSLDWDELAFELFEAEQFHGDLRKEIAVVDRAANTRSVHTLYSTFDLTYLRVGTAQQIAQKVNAPSSWLVFLFGGGAFIWMRKRSSVVAG